MQILGYTESTTACDCCGKVNLKGTYVMDDNQGGIFNYGVTCGANAINITVKDLKKEIKLIEAVENTDEAMTTAKTESSKFKVYKQAINKGYNKENFFKKYGTFSEAFGGKKYYTFAHLTCGF